MAKLLLIYGGIGLSEEADISIRSGENFHQALTVAGVETDALILNADNASTLPDILEGYDLVVPILHGKFGEDGQIQTIFERAGVHYLGSDSIASALCFNKVRCKQRLGEGGILTPQGHVITSLVDLEAGKLPVVSKPIVGGGSLGLTIARELDADTKNHIQDSLTQYGELLVEELIVGQEISVGILGDTALPVIEIIMQDNQAFDYDAKYSGKIEENCPPKHLSQSLQLQAQQIALKAHQACGCRHLSRVDMIVRGEEIFVLEINTLPGMTAHSLYPKEAMTAGYSMPMLAHKLVELAQGD